MSATLLDTNGNVLIHFTEDVPLDSFRKGSISAARAMFSLSQADGSFPPFSRLFSEHEVQNLRMEGAHVRDQPVYSSNILGLRAAGATFDRVSWQGTKVQDSDFLGTQFIRNRVTDDTKFMGTNLGQTTWTRPVFDRAFFIQCDLTDAAFANGSIERPLVFNNCLLPRVAFQGCGGGGIHAEKSDFSDSLWERGGFGGSRFTEASFVRARFVTGSFENARFIDCDFTSAEITNSAFYACHFTNCNFTGCVFRGTAFCDPRISNCSPPATVHNCTWSGHSPPDDWLNLPEPINTTPLFGTPRRPLP